jgi:hypothetical protein
VERLDTQGRLDGVPVATLIVTTAGQLRDALAAPTSVGLDIAINKSTAPALRQLTDTGRSLVLYQPTYEKLTEQMRHDVPLAPLLSSLSYPFEVRGIAHCLSARHAVVPPALALRSTSILPQGSLEPFALTQQFIDEQFRVYSSRCETCPCRSTCVGMHINWVRAHGYRRLDPQACAAPSARTDN